MSHLASKVHSADTQLEYNFNKEYMHLHKFGQKFTLAHIGSSPSHLVPLETKTILQNHPRLI
jgi:hypothetical protein